MIPGVSGIFNVAGPSNFELIGIAPTLALLVDDPNCGCDNILLFCPLSFSVYGHNRGMDDASYIAKFSCSICGKRYVVMTLARDCEDKHLED